MLRKKKPEVRAAIGSTAELAKRGRQYLARAREMGMKTPSLAEALANVGVPRKEAYRILCAQFGMQGLDPKIAGMNATRQLTGLYDPRVKEIKKEKAAAGKP